MTPPAGQAGHRRRRRKVRRGGPGRIRYARHTTVGGIGRRGRGRPPQPTIRRRRSNAWPSVTGSGTACTGWPRGPRPSPRRGQPGTGAHLRRPQRLW